MKLLGKLPSTTYLAFSGGSDSTSVLKFLLRTRNVTLVHFVHNSKFARTGLEFTEQIASKYNCNLIVGTQTTQRKHKQSLEEYWRIDRMEFLHSINAPIMTAHNLNDNIESWLMGTCHGQPKLIPYRNNNIIRPFMLFTKEELSKHLNGQTYLTDPSNYDHAFTRAYVRNIMVPNALQVNPGLFKVIKRKVLQKYQNDNPT
jgi:tRNA(Ile)-lysidine synthase TilS/MesJ